MSRSQRVKGAAGEREWCAELGKFGFAAKRALGQARDGGGDVPVPPVLWEVKRHKAFAVYGHVEQAIAAMPQYAGCSVPAVALRGDKKEWLVVLRAADFLAILAGRSKPTADEAEENTARVV